MRWGKGWKRSGNARSVDVPIQVTQKRNVMMGVAKGRGVASL